MANNAAAYRYFVGFKFSDLECADREEVSKGVSEGYLRIEVGTRIVRAIPQPSAALPTHNGRFWA